MPNQANHGDVLSIAASPLAQNALLQGQPLKLIADEVGYGSETALSRAFKAGEGCTPREWLKREVLDKS